MTVLATDNFNRANGGLGANWTDDNAGGSWSISSNQAVPVNNQDNESHYSAVTWPNDHYCKAQMYANTTNTDTGPSLMVRHTGDYATGSKYFSTVNHLGTNNVSVYKDVSNAYTLLTRLTQSWTDGDTWEVDVQGTTLTTKLNGSTIDSRSDSALATGSPGIFGSGTITTSAALDNWEGGDFASVSASLVATAQIVASINQLVFPVSDVNNPGNWTQDDGVTTTNLWSRVNEPVINNATFDESPTQPNQSHARVRLGTVNQPSAGTITLHTIAFKDVSQGTVDYSVALMQGGTTIQSFTHTNIGTGFTQYDDVISNAITDWSTPFDVDWTMNETT